MLTSKQILYFATIVMLNIVRPVFAQTVKHDEWMFCVGSTSTFLATPSGDGAPSVFNYQILTLDRTLLLDASSHIDTIMIPWDYPAGKYLLGVQEILDVKGGEICPGKWVYDTVTLVSPTPILLSSDNRYRLCGDSAATINFNEGKYVNYRLTPDGSWKTIAGNPIIIAQAGQYQLTVEDAVGCRAEAAFTIFPSIRALFGNDTLICTSEFLLTLRQTENNPDGTVYTWFHSSDDKPFGAVVQSGEQIQLEVVENDITQSNTYWVQAEFGDCTVGDTIVVSCNETPQPDLSIPNTITPNVDGENDVWNIGNVENYPKIEVEIFDRWGRRVYHVKDGYRPWNGRDMSGKPLPVEAYYYIIHLNDGLHKHPLTGVIHIIK